MTLKISNNKHLDEVEFLREDYFEFENSGTEIVNREFDTFFPFQFRKQNKPTGGVFPAVITIMFSSNSSSSNIQSSYQENFGEQIYYGSQEEEGSFRTTEPETKKHIEVGDYLPYGPRLYYETTDKFVRMKDFGEHSRILLMGVLGSFTPDCWNRHLFLVLRKLRYYEERNVDYICCVSTNDPFTQKAWGEYLACENEIFMLADPTTRFTKAMGMDIVLPWLDNCVRSRRYLLFAEDMLVTKMILSNCDDANLEWQCEHVIRDDFFEEEEEEDSSDPWM